MDCKVTFYPDDKSIKVKSGTTVLDAAKRARVAIRTRCGGHASCLMCKVTVHDQSGLSPIASKEAIKLGDLKDRSIRLSCQARLMRNTEVIIPEDPLKAAIRAQLAKQREEDDF
jgi:2Fe-2S ferredoxin